MSDGENKPVIAVLGGSGDLGGGLALRWAVAGYPVIIGSRTQEKADAAAASLNERDDLAEAVRGMANEDAAQAGEVVVMTVPFANHQSTLEAIRDAVQGKIFIDVTVPLVPPKVGTVQLPEGGSASARAQAYLGEEVRVVSAYQNVAAAHLNDLSHDPECDVLICGNDKDACAAVVVLTEAAGMKGWHAGPIANAVVAEAMTSVLITLNRRYKIPGSGFRITGTPGV
ncbi:MAG TPA: NADPH-dependent F420 reductase [Porticoccaceae bacterium]|nr:NADPH-dependent F420 reductase [Porticoccaceae bacterium]HCO60884.1 NADPH-dependent F420 reductase [Porticoccaceae bacterium]